MTTISSPIEPINNPINNRTYKVQSIDKICVSDEQIKRIVSICNEPLVFQTLFSEMFTDGIYPLSSAQEWISWGRDGWLQETHFVFAVLDTDGLVVAACDIKSNDKESAEIGYWSSSEHRGVITNSVKRMLDLAWEAGFKGFHAEVHNDNARSKAVLERVGFSESNITASRNQHKTYKKANRSSRHLPRVFC